MTETEKLFKQNLCILRESKGLSRYNICTVLKIDNSYYNRLENLERSVSPTFELLEKIADFYNIKVCDLFCEDIEKHINEMEHSARLEKIYATIFVNRMDVNILYENEIEKKPLYIPIGIKMNGRKEVIGAYIGEKESTKYWTDVLEEFKCRGMEEVLLLSSYDIQELRKTLSILFPKAKCICNILEITKEVSVNVKSKELVDFKQDFRKIYISDSIADAEELFLSFKEKWDNKYPNAISTLEESWNEIESFFSYPQEIRKLIYKIRYIESFETQLKKSIKEKGYFESEELALKFLYSEIQNATEKWTGQFGVVWDWANIYAQIKEL